MSNNLLREVFPAFIKSSKLQLLEDDAEVEIEEDEDEDEDEEYTDFWYLSICRILSFWTSGSINLDTSSSSSVISDTDIAI